MTAAVEADPRIGSMLPRIYTPPLPANCTGPTVAPLPPKHPLYGVPQECPCGCGLNPNTSWGFLCIDFLERIPMHEGLRWQLLPWQRWLYWHALEKRLDGTGFRFRILLVLVGRQCGKTTWGRGLGLWRLFMDKQGRRDPQWPAAKLAVVAAQNLDYAEATLKEVVDEIRDSPLLAPELVNHRVTNGKHRAILTYRRNWRAATASRKGGRSLPVDFAWLDEIREHTTWDAWRAIEPTTSVQICSQLLATSNAGDKRSIVLRDLRDAQIRAITTGTTTSTRTGFFEWSVPDDVDPREPKYWHMAQPALGWLNEFVLEDLIGKFEATQAGDMAGFQTEYLCQWVDSLLPGIIPAQAWADTVDKQTRRAPGAAAYVCLDMNYHRTMAYAAVAALRDDGHIHTEIMAQFKGIDPLIAWLNGLDEAGVVRKTKFAGICAQKSGAPISGSIDDIRAAGIDITDWGAPLGQLAGGAGEFYDAVVGADTTAVRVYHRPVKALDRAAASTVARTIGDAWFFDRRRSPIDASPLVACCGAVWLMLNPPEAEGEPQVHEWPSEEVIEQWRKEADERWGQETDE